jgi:allantoinase
MPLPDLVVRSRHVVTRGGAGPASVHIRRGRIIGILDFDDVPSGCQLDDAGTAAIIPGLVDTHVRAQATGWDAELGFEVTTRAAAAGGVTTIIEEPFEGNPPVTSVTGLEARRRVAEGHCCVDVGFWAGAVPGNERELGPLLTAGAFGIECALIACDGGAVRPVTEADLRVIMPALARVGALLVVHAEVPGPIEAARARARASRSWVERLPFSKHASKYTSYLLERPKEAENDAIALLLRLCADYRTSTHILHLSSSDALTAIYHARGARLPVTVETCPHYLCFAAEDVPDGATAFACAPPIRERANREFLWAAVANGLVQMVVSDHRPSPGTMARTPSRDFATARNGIPSLQLGLTATWTEASQRGYRLPQVVDWMCRATAALARLARKGHIDVGYDADLVVFDPDVEFVVDGAALAQGHAGTPYDGRRLRGMVERTYLRGQRVYGRAEGWSDPRGRLLTRAPG